MQGAAPSRLRDWVIAMCIFLVPVTPVRTRSCHWERKSPIPLGSGSLVILLWKLTDAARYSKISAV